MQLDERKMLSSIDTINSLQEAFSQMFAITRSGFGKCNIRFLILPKNSKFDDQKGVYCEINRN
jgi:hypothetical protein